VFLPRISDLFVIEAAITAEVAKPTLLPICDTVLNTPPASAWVLAGKIDVITRLDIVYWMSAPIGLRARAGNSYAQYEAVGFRTAMIKGEMQEIIVPIVTNRSARTRSTIRPITTLVNAPVTGAGRNLSELSSADMC